MFLWKTQRLEQELQRRLSVPDGKEEVCSSRSLSAAARRSFFRRKNRHKRSTSREGKDAPAPDAISTDSIPYMEGEKTPQQHISRVPLRFRFMGCAHWANFREPLPVALLSIQRVNSTAKKSAEPSCAYGSIWGPSWKGPTLSIWPSAQCVHTLSSTEFFNVLSHSG